MYCIRCSSAVAVGSAACPSCGYEISRIPPAKVAPVVAAPVAVVAPVAQVAPDEDEDDDESDEVEAPVVTAAMQSEIDALLAQNRVIEAIKLYRERMSVGLKEAKDAIDEMRAAK
jgi:ribosomal protein L7/L12